MLDFNNIEECKKAAVAFVEEDGDYSDEEWLLITDSFKVEEEQDDVVEHKMVYSTTIVSVNGLFFSVTQFRDNCGYWGDGEHYDPEVEQVTPVKKVVEITEWKVV